MHEGNHGPDDREWVRFRTPSRRPSAINMEMIARRLREKRDQRRARERLEEPAGRDEFSNPVEPPVVIDARLGKARRSSQSPRCHLSRRSFFPRNRVEGDLAVLMMNHLAPRPSRDLCPWERVEGVLVDVVAARTVVARERLKRLDRVEDVADVAAFGDVVAVGHGDADQSQTNSLFLAWRINSSKVMN